MKTKAGKVGVKGSRAQCVQKTTLHKRNKKAAEKKTIFPVIFTSVMGGGSFGSAFGVQGVLIGMAVGGGIGVFLSRENG